MEDEQGRSSSAQNASPQESQFKIRALNNSYSSPRGESYPDNRITETMGTTLEIPRHGTNEALLASQVSGLRVLIDKTEQKNTAQQGILNQNVSKKKVCMVYHVTNMRQSIGTMKLDDKDLEFEKRKELAVSLRQLLRSELFILDYSELETYQQEISIDTRLSNTYKTASFQ